MKTITSKVYQRGKLLEMRKKRYVITAIVLFTIIGSAYLFNRLHVSSPDIVMSVNGEQVTKEELQTELGLTSMKGSSKEALHRAEHAIVRFKVQWALAKQLGIVDSSTLDQLRQMENSERQQKQQKQQVVYGVTQLSAHDYQDYALSKSVIELKEKLLADGVITVTNAELKQKYEEVKVSYRKQDAITIHKITVDKRDSDGQVTKSSIQKAREKMEDIERKIANGSDFDVIAKSVNASNQIMVQQFTDKTSRIDENAYSYLLEEAKLLQEGQVGQVLENETELTLIRCISRVPQGYTPLNEIQDRIKIMLTNEKYEKYVDQLVLKAKVITDANK
ncbi:hypothetical protein J2Z69_000993 [Paenibacillus shirakamiensis]|uniref:peptidylprolyl isomerase n=1 Tax=Paenibacillus shirakamiensis TaxID=1265935 RepID=A0ABS4JE21_9BACL|nr:peptidyl-prolyl cis-trans isomerase [Paenibacillus shirakamiensis]MBP1999974.1 hypothetical protein [Paenibacillus shirakamiensis]